MMYRQIKVADKSLLATKVSLKVNGKWFDGKLLDKDGKELPLPHNVDKGKTYIVEVKV